MKSAEEDAYCYAPSLSFSLPLDDPCLSPEHHGTQASRGRYYPRPNGTPALERPRIEITSYGHFPEEDAEDSSGTGNTAAKQVNSIVTLTLPNADGYRDPSCLSPASSMSSRSCHSEASSHESGLSCNYENSPQNSPWQSPCVSPKGGSPRTSVSDESWIGSRPLSQPSSPCGGKRKYSFSETGSGCLKYHLYSPSHSPGPSPRTSPRLSVTDDTWMANTNQYTNSAIVAAINALSTDGVSDLGEGVPLKARKTCLEPCLSINLKMEPRGVELSPAEFEDQEEFGPSSRLPFKKDTYGRSFLDVPQHAFTWASSKPYMSASLPALDWQLPTRSGLYSLQIEVQPKSHHRAHYETEGSRGAVKALAGNHPVVQLHGYTESDPLTLQLFIGTADDRLLRPHAFYQVHRITGKTVSTPTHEVLHCSTKVLEIPLLPENNMRAVIDCAGILKLRNSDIELRKGETDIGRKNTRVRMVFRVHINQPNGRTISLQVASSPIECSQRSAQELPLVDKQSVESCCASGGERMLLTGHNFHPDSRVVFVEKAQDGCQVWEKEAKVDKAASSSTSLLVDIPPYHNQKLSCPVVVNFFVCSGKHRRSQCQHFTYLPPNVLTIKTEPHDDYEVHRPCSQNVSGLTLPSNPYYSPEVLPPVVSVDLRPNVSFTACPQRLGGKPSSFPLSSSPSPSAKLQDLSPTHFPKSLYNGSSPHQMGPHQSLVVQQGPDAQSASGCFQQSLLYPPRIIAGPAGLHSTSPNITEEHPFHSTHHIAPSQPTTEDTNQCPQLPKGTGKSSPSSFSPDGGKPSPAAVSIKQEPQELDQVYLDDGKYRKWIYSFM
uniref:RHD domain-containing protein n=1 Tax=Denticeps clupeoides TaxID=299321 RepID=A0AAY4E6B9_9TELE